MIKLSLGSANRLLSSIEELIGSVDNAKAESVTTESRLAVEAKALKEEIERAKATQAATDRIVAVLMQYPEFAVQEYLSEQVLDLASGDASDINNNSMDSQVYYLLADSPMLSLERSEADLLKNIEEEFKNTPKNPHHKA